MSDNLLTLSLFSDISFTGETLTPVSGSEKPSRKSSNYHSLKVWLNWSHYDLGMNSHRLTKR